MNGGTGGDAQEPDVPGHVVPEAGREPAPASAEGDSDPLRRWTLLLLTVIVLMTAAYLRGDRVTPVTSQARVHALVVPIASEVSGTITDVLVRNNQSVTAGQPLFQIDLERYRLAVAGASAALEQARQAEAAARANIDAARAQLDSALASEERQRLDTRRIRAIREQDTGAISKRRLESAEASLVSARSRVAAAKAALEAAIQQLGAEGERNAQVQQARAALESAQLDLDRATVRAPSDGVVTGVRLDRGNFAAAGSPQMTFIGLENVWVQAEFTENNLGHIDPGDAVGIVFDVHPGQVIDGRVREVGFGVSLDDPPLGSLPTIRNDNNWLRDAQRYPVLVDFEAPRQEGRLRLRVGSQATVLVYSGDHLLFNFLARLYLRLLSWLTYAY